jgi:hypothetical protein
MKVEAPHYINLKAKRVRRGEVGYSQAFFSKVTKRLLQHPLL